MKKSTKKAEGEDYTQAPSEHFYLRDRWAGPNAWARRGPVERSLKDAKREAKRLLRGIGKGGRVQVIRVSFEVVGDFS